MKAILFSIGTRGDIEPFLAISQLLKEKGWDVICVFPEQFREIVEDMGIPFRGFSREFLDMLDSKDAKMFMGGHGSILTRIKFLLKMARVGIKLSKSFLSLQHNIQQEEKPDRVIYHPKCNYSLIWGMANPGKSIMVSPIPGTAHTIRHLTILGNYGKTLNTLSFWLSNSMKAIILKKVSKKYSKDYPKLKISFSSIKRIMLQKEKTLYTISSSLFSRPEYWPLPAQIVGYYERDKTTSWCPDDLLLKFLKNHEKIVFISFGSMTNSDPKEKTRIIIDVLKKNNIPAIINTSWGGLEKIDKPLENIHFVSNIPYDWIFPKIYAAVHHGGSGTTHTALRYACPSLIVPHILDQFFWKKTISTLNLGPSGIPIKKLNEQNFENKLLDLISNKSYKKNSELISEKMKIESNKNKLYKMIKDLE
ncbi:glycosyltransferase [Winogradskyella immobilis]|uniref:Glycosyltransferase family 1 protein n=1 Tax=Winogradskyella immobilis TaxID=2816852 RepID=A0ABS8EQZ5_9FLAO|nr:glycosyltransferase [Winogradskyella immobilis]MCC1485649.1 glycosyltransferase family 1 protein [Winogradskyella immobilis]MCG0017742.1 glycosyltransferase [Winogradskyella immobilis]